MRNVTLGELKTRSRQRADMVNTQFVDDDELVTYINESITDLYDLLTTSYDEDYHLKSEEIFLVNNQEDYDLPADFYKLRGVDLVHGANDSSSMLPFNFQERNRYKNSLIFDYTRNGITGSRYRLYGNKIKFTPIPDNNEKVLLWYTPTAEILENDADLLDGVNGYEELVIIKTAIKMMNKEESDTSALERRYQEIWERVMTTAPNRDAANPESVQDVRRDDFNEDFLYHGL